METIFDHGVTAEELGQLGIDEITREEYESAYDQQGAYITLYRLMDLRDDQEAKARYYALIEDKHFIDFNVGYRDLLTD